MDAERLPEVVGIAPLMVWDDMFVWGLPREFYKGAEALGINDIHVLDPPLAVNRWGAPASKGALIIRTQHARADRLAERLPQIARMLEHFDALDPAPPPLAGRARDRPIIMVDGRVLTARQADEMSRSRARRIELFRGAAAARLFGDRGWRGVVVVCVDREPGAPGACN